MMNYPMKIRELFSKEPCNTGRQPEIDLAKALLLLLLAYVHCIIECTPDEELSSGIPYLFDSVIGGPLGAPVFMFAMGFGMVYTRHNTPKDFVHRAGMLAICAFVLNLCRFTAPFLLGYLITGDSEKYLSDLLFRTFENDILTFAALTFLLMALLLKLKMPPWGMLLTAFAMSGAATFLNGIDVKNDLGNIFLGYFIGTEDEAGMVRSYFVLFNWFVVPVFGYFIGHCFVHLKDKNKFYITFALPAALIAVVYLDTGIAQHRGVFDDGQLSYYHITTPDVICTLIVIIALMGFYHVISQHLPRRANDLIHEISRQVNVIYCLHWIMVGVSVNLVIYAVKGTQILPLWQTMLLATFITAAAVALAIYIGRKRHPDAGRSGGQGSVKGN